jgi:hypothetical protein
MKKFPVIVLVVASLAFASFAEAAKPKKRTRNANRVGAYGAIFVGQARYSGDQTLLEQQLSDFLQNQNAATQNISTSTKSNDIGYQATFGFRFNRYFAAELGLAQYGELSSSVKGDIDLGGGFVPASVKLAFNVGGPVISAVGILPLGKKAEAFARVGYLFASSERSLSTRLDGQNGGSNSAKGDSQNVVYGVGFAWHINQVYTIRAEYQKIDNVGQESRTGTEDLSIIGAGVLIRF